jgi:hypothetical protein
MEISQKEIQVLEKQVSPLVEKANSYVINSVEVVDEASAFLKQVKDAETNIEGARLKITAPLNQSLKEANDLFRNLRAPLEQARTLLTGKILAWKQAETRRIEAEEAKARKLQDYHESVGHNVSAPKVLERLDNKIGNTQTVKFWTWELVDRKLVPDAYKMIDNVKINQDVRNGVRAIPGLKIYQDERLSIVGR